MKKNLFARPRARSIEAPEALREALRAAKCATAARCASAPPRPRAPAPSLRRGLRRRLRLSFATSRPALPHGALSPRPHRTNHPDDSSRRDGHDRDHRRHDHPRRVEVVAPPIVHDVKRPQEIVDAPHPRARVVTTPREASTQTAVPASSASSTRHAGSGFLRYSSGRRGVAPRRQHRAAPPRSSRDGLRLGALDGRVGGVCRAQPKHGLAARGEPVRSAASGAQLERRDVRTPRAARRRSTSPGPSTASSLESWGRGDGRDARRATGRARRA